MLAIAALVLLLVGLSASTPVAPVPGTDTHPTRTERAELKQPVHDAAFWAAWAHDDPSVVLEPAADGDEAEDDQDWSAWAHDDPAMHLEKPSEQNVEDGEQLVTVDSDKEEAQDWSAWAHGDPSMHLGKPSAQQVEDGELLATVAGSSTRLSSSRPHSGNWTSLHTTIRTISDEVEIDAPVLSSILVGGVATRLLSSMEKRLV